MKRLTHSVPGSWFQVPGSRFLVPGSWFGESDSYDTHSNYDRCITRGVVGSILPVIYGNGTNIMQGPGYVVIRNEMIHEARLVPLDGRSHVGRNIHLYMGDPRGHWEGNTLVVDSTNFTDRTARACTSSSDSRASMPAPSGTSSRSTTPSPTRGRGRLRSLSTRSRATG